jgi:AcrR family transcriptional regulator
VVHEGRPQRHGPAVAVDRACHLGARPTDVVTRDDGAGLDDDGRPGAQPASLTPKGQRTRARILASSRRVLERKGYFDASVTDVTVDSELALGTFYRYFTNKEGAFMVLLEELVEELYDATGGSWSEEDPIGSLVEATRRYLTAYNENRLLIAALLQMSAASPEGAAAWVELRERTHRRMAAYIPGTGVGDHGPLAISALATMVEYSAHRWFVERGGNGAPDVEQAAQTLGLIWYRALYATHDPLSHPLLDRP